MPRPVHMFIAGGVELYAETSERKRARARPTRALEKRRSRRGHHGVAPPTNCPLLRATDMWIERCRRMQSWRLSCADKRLGRSLLFAHLEGRPPPSPPQGIASLMLTRTAFQMLRRAKATRTLTAALTTLILTPTAMASPTQWRAAGMQTGILGSRRAPGGDGGALRPRRPKTGVGITVY